MFIPIEVQYILHGTAQLEDIKAVLFKAGQEVTSVAEELVKWSTTGSDLSGLPARDAPCFEDLETESSGASSSRSQEPQEVIVLPALPRALLSQLEEYSSSQYNCTSRGIVEAESTDFGVAVVIDSPRQAEGESVGLGEVELSDYYWGEGRKESSTPNSTFL